MPTPPRNPGESLTDYAARLKEYYAAEAAKQTTPVSAAPKVTTPPTDYQAKNVADERRQQLASGRYVEEQSLIDRGFWRAGDAAYVNPQTRETWNRDASSGLWSTTGYKTSATDMRALQAQQQAGAKLAAPTGGQAVAPAATVPTVAKSQGAIYPNEAALQAAKDANYGFLEGKLLDTGRFASLPKTVTDTLANYQMVTGLPTYGLEIRGGPGRAGYQSLSHTKGGTGEYARALQEIAPLPKTYGDVALLENPDYNAKAPYAGGEPSFASTYMGAPATAHFGTAGAEIRGGARGGIGIDAGQILAAHGIAPSEDPAENMARALDLASGEGLFSFASGGKWIADATANNKGAFASAAKRAGMSTREFAQMHKGDSGTMGKRARLALTLMKFEDGGAVYTIKPKVEMQEGGAGMVAQPFMSQGIPPLGFVYPGYGGEFGPYGYSSGKPFNVPLLPEFEPAFNWRSHAAERPGGIYRHGGSIPFEEYSFASGTGQRAFVSPEEIIGVGKDTGIPWFRLGENVDFPYRGGNQEMISFPNSNTMQVEPMRDSFAPPPPAPPAPTGVAAALSPQGRRALTRLLV